MTRRLFDDAGVSGTLNVARCNADHVPSAARDLAETSTGSTRVTGVPPLVVVRINSASNEMSLLVSDT